MSQPWTDFEATAEVLLTTAIVADLRVPKILRVERSDAGYGVVLGDVFGAKRIGSAPSLSALLLALDSYLEHRSGIPTTVDERTARKLRYARGLSFERWLEDATRRVWLAEQGIVGKPMVLFRTHALGVPARILMGEDFLLQHETGREIATVARSGCLQSILRGVGTILVAESLVARMQAAAVLQATVDEFDAEAKVQVSYP